MSYEVLPYDQSATIYEVLEDGIPVFYGTQAECNSYMSQN